MLTQQPVAESLITAASSSDPQLNPSSYSVLFVCVSPPRCAAITKENVVIPCALSYISCCSVLFFPRNSWCTKFLLAVYVCVCVCLYCKVQINRRTLIDEFVGSPICLNASSKTKRQCSKDTHRRGWSYWLSSIDLYFKNAPRKYIRRARGVRGGCSTSPIACNFSKNTRRNTRSKPLTI